MMPYCEYFTTTAIYEDYCILEDDTNNYSGLVNDATYDISIKIGRDMEDLPVKEIGEGICAEMIVIKDLNTNRSYKYASLNEALNIWNLSEEDETLVQAIDSRHETYKIWYSPRIYVIGPTADYMYRAYEELCERLDCYPILANTRIQTFGSLEEIFKARSMEVEKMKSCTYVLMILPHKATRLSVEMKMMEKIAKDLHIPIIYTQDPTEIPKETSKSNNVSIESSDSIKSVDLADSLDN